MTATMLDQQPDAASTNPLGLNGFEFVEFTSPDPDAMAAQFEALGFTATHRHPTKNITRYKQGRINLMLNRDDAGRVAAFRGVHGRSIMGPRPRKRMTR